LQLHFFPYLEGGIWFGLFPNKIKAVNSEHYRRNAGMAQLFVSLYHYFRRRLWLLLGLMGVFVLCAAYWGSKLRFEEDITRLMPIDEEVAELTNLLQHAGFADKLIVHIWQADSLEPPRPDSLVQHAARLAAQLRRQFSPTYIAEVREQVPDDQMRQLYDFFYAHLPLFLDEQDYEDIERLMQPATFARNFDRNYKLLLSPASAMLKQQVLRDPLGMTPLALRKLQQLQLDENFSLYQGYVLTRDQRHLLMFITPAHDVGETAANGKLIEGLDRLMDSLALQPVARQFHTEYYGGTAVAVANAKQIKRDVMLTVSIAMLAILLLVGLFFRRLHIFLFLLLPVAFGGGLGLMLMYFLRGEVSAISLGIGSVLIGITIDYSLHLFTHYRNTGQVERVLRDVTQPLLVSCLTTAAAFLCLLAVRARAMNDLGLFAAFGVSGAALFALLLLPHLFRFATKATNRQQAATWLDRLAALRFDRNRPLLLGILLLSLICILAAPHARFESDLMKLNYFPPHLLKAEQRLNAVSNVSRRSVYLIASGDSLDEALLKLEKVSPAIDSLKAAGLVKGYSGVDQLLCSRQEQLRRIRRWQSFWQAERRQKLLRQLDSLARAYQFTPEAFAPFVQLLQKSFHPITDAELEALKKTLLADYLSEAEGRSLLISVLKIDREDTGAIYAALGKADGVNLLDRQYLTTHFLRLLQEDFDLLVKISLLIVFLILVHALGRIELGLIAFIPIVLSWLWTIGLMGLLGLSFNIFNIIISTFIFGLGIDYSIFVMRAMMQEYKYGRENLHSYKSSIFLSAFTTLAGIGVLVLARHPALQSIALLSIIGIVSVVLMAMSLEPLMFRWLVEHEGKRRSLPVVWSDLLVALLIFLVFLLGSLALTVIGFLFFKLIPWGKERKKLMYHQLISWTSKAIVYLSFHIRKKVIYHGPDPFKEPAVIIANHQSHIDLVLILMLHPKIIVLTNDWVWNNRFYGRIVKFADFYPVSQGFEEGMEKFRERVAAGYSILVFPEGTRSPDGRMRRFHKGAFLLAEELQLDILPILLHGPHDCMPKGEPFLRGGRVSIHLLPRISKTSTQFGHTYQERTKAISRYMRAQYERIKKETETPAYFRKKLIKNYLYKGPVLEWYFRVKIRLEQDYEPFHKLLPLQGQITDLGCGYGFMVYMLSFLSPKRKLLGIDYDEDKIAVANHCLAKSENTTFVVGDVARYPLPQSDAFIISDVLHYLRPEEQQQLIRQCIAQLRPGGKLIIRDGNAALKSRHRGTKLTEVFSTGSGFNKTRNQLFFLSEADIQQAIRGLPVQMKVIDNTTLTSNVIYVISQKKEAAVT